MNKQQIYQLVIIILMVVAICALILALVTLIKNRDIIRSDPLIYGMNVHNFTSCACIDNVGKIWNSKDNGFIHTEQGQTTSNNYNNFSVNDSIFIK